MKASEIRRRFLEYFHERGHEIRPSASLVPADDPTLLFTNAGMVPFKRVFLGLETTDYRRATTSQKCVRAGGKHNDLEQVGETTRHHTFFEMLGNFSFGDYFKREAIQYAWELLTDVYGLDPDRIYATVHHTDDEAADLWVEVTGVPAERVYRLGDKDNFWQMADTGPCGPCSELHYDLRPEAEWGTILSTEEFERRGEAGDFLELWNLVFMQFDRDAEGVLHPLPAPSIDTGAGLERIAAVLQGTDSNFHTDLFMPLIERAVEVIHTPYDPNSASGLSYRVLADHARAVAFLVADGIYPSNEGRGYVLRRILRRGVRHAWLLGRREPTLVSVVEAVIETMGEAYPGLVSQREHVLTTTRDEEERFLRTIEGGMGRFDELAPALSDTERPGSGGDASGPIISGEEVFRLYDTFGFPPDLTELMARERGYRIDREGFEAALGRQRQRSRADRATYDLQSQVDEGWTVLDADTEQTFVGYDRTEVDTRVLALWQDGDRMGVQLAENPFYLEAGGQISDRGTVVGDGWTLDVEDVRRVGGGVALFGPVAGVRPSAEGPLPVTAAVAREVRRNTERNHTATHLLHAALRQVLGTHVAQRGSLVAPDRLRFDFSHTGPVSAEELRQVESIVNTGVWEDHPVMTAQTSYDEAVERGAMALFGEKYGDVVRVVDVPGVSTELCGGTHVRHTAEIGLFKFVSEGGVAAGVRRVEAVTGPGAFAYFEEVEEHLGELSELLKTPRENLDRRIEHLLDQNRELESLLKELRRGGGGGGETLVSQADIAFVDGRELVYKGVRLRARNADDVRQWGDAFLESSAPGVAVVAAELPSGKHTLFSFVSDDLISSGIRADAVIREVAAEVGGRGGGRPHMAQAGVEDPGRIDAALKAGARVVRALTEE